MVSVLSLFLRLSLILCALLAVIIAGVRLLSYDAAYFGQIRHALRPDDSCAAPCYLGITPDETNANGTLERLNNHAWVEGVSTMAGFFAITSDDTFSTHSPVIEWQWNGAQPPLLQGTNRIETTARQYIVKWLSMPTTATLGEVRVALGSPQNVLVDGQFIILFYEDVAVRAQVQCEQLWSSPAMLFIVPPVAGGVATSDIYQIACTIR